MGEVFARCSTTVERRASGTKLRNCKTVGRGALHIVLLVVYVGSLWRWLQVYIGVGAVVGPGKWLGGWIGDSIRPYAADDIRGLLDDIPGGMAGRMSRWECIR